MIAEAEPEIVGRPVQGLAELNAQAASGTGCMPSCHHAIMPAGGQAGRRACGDLHVLRCCDAGEWGVHPARGLLSRRHA